MSRSSYFHKRQLILNIINHLGPISRTELITLTDYRPASVTTIIRDLLDEKLVSEVGYSSQGYGRRRAMLEINKEYLCAIGMSIFQDKVIYIVSQIDGTILYEDTRNISSGVSRGALVEEIISDVRKLLKDFSDKRLIGIGISEPPYDPTLYQPSHTLKANVTDFNQWIHQNLKPRLEELSGLLVETYSGVAMPAMAEQRFGVAKGIQNFICVELSNGIGASICCNGKPVVGATGIAGELGHTVIDYSNASQNVCYCGRVGCVEGNTAYPALVSQITAALDRGVLSALNSYPERGSNITVEAIRRALDENDRLCMHFVKESATRIGVAVSNAVNLLNPEMVVFYGFMLGLGDYFIQHLENALRENVGSLSCDFEINTSDSMENAFPLGTVAEIFSSYLEQDNYKWVYQLRPDAYKEHSGNSDIFMNAEEESFDDKV